MKSPEGASSTSIAQISQINFKTGSDGVISKEGDQIYVYIDGNKISQNFIQETADAAFIADLTAAPFPDTTGWTQNDYDREAGRISTYKALADKISEIPGIVSYMVSEEMGANNDVLESDDIFKESIKNEDMYKGILEIKSLIPGDEIVIGEVASVSGSVTNQGNALTTISAEKGSGLGGLESSKEALSKLITGNQQDVYTDLVYDGDDYTYGLRIFDKELNRVIPVPNDGTEPLQMMPLTISAPTDIDDFITKFNTAAAAATPQMTDYVNINNIEGNLVIETKNSNFDVEFTGSLKKDTTPLDKNNDLSGRKGAGAEFLEIKTIVDQVATKGSLQLRLDTLGISDSAFGEFAVDNTGLITMKQDGVEFAIGQTAVALFNNNRGLQAVGDNLLKKTGESGEPIYNLNNDKIGQIQSKTLELSTADLSKSLVNLMVFQRAFEANAKSITTADAILNTLINLKR